MSSKKTLRQILDASDKCFLVPCVYDCASNHAVEMCGFPVSLLSGGEVSISRNGVIDYGFTNLTDLEEVISRVASTSAIPLIADIEDGFGGPLAVYRAAKRLAAAGAAAVLYPAGLPAWTKGVRCVKPVIYRFALLSKRWMAPTAC